MNRFLLHHRLASDAGRMAYVQNPTIGQQTGCALTHRFVQALASANRVALVEVPSDLSVATQCALLSLNRTSQY